MTELIPMIVICLCGSRTTLILKKPFLAFSLDYPGVGPEHSFLKDAGRAEYYSVTDEEALEGI